MQAGAAGSADTQRSRTRRRIAPFVLVALLVGAGPLLSGAAGGGPVQAATGPDPGAGRAAAPSAPSFVYLNADDLSEDLVPLMPNLTAMTRQGWAARNFLVNNSLCCPSRTSTLAGRYSHTTGVFANEGPRGGYTAAVRLGFEQDTLATDLSKAGYRTALVGKYLNGYRDLTVVPPGWTTWQASSNPYEAYGFRLSNNGSPVSYDGLQNFQPDVFTTVSTDFIDASVAAGKPFFLYLAPGLPHAPSVHTLADAAAYADARPVLPPSYGRRMSGAPQWLAEVPALTAGSRANLLREYRIRLWSALTVDRMLGRLRAHLAERGIDDVYVVLTSDNGFHLGQHSLRAGKQTPYEYDIQVPFVVTGPGVAAGARYGRLLQNVDVRSTVLDLAGLPPARTDGVSFASVLDGSGTAGRRVALLEHVQTIFEGPDYQGKAAGRIPDYVAVRTPDALYVAYAKGRNRLGYHDLRSDPWQLRNTFSSLTPQQRRWWADVAARLAACRGRACAELPLPPLPDAATPGGAPAARMR